MITLDGNESLLIVAGSAVSTDVIVECAGAPTEQLNIAEATTKEVVAGPATIERIWVTNTTGSAQTITLQKSVRGNRTYQVGPVIDLASGEAWHWSRETGPLLLDATGRQRINNS